MYNAAERKHVKEKARDARLLARDDAAMVSAIMEQRQGRAWMLNLLTMCSIFATTYSGNALSSAFAEGQRNIGLFLLNSIMQACPDLYVQMMKEGNERERAANARHERLDDDDATADYDGRSASRYDDRDGEAGTVTPQSED